MNLVAQRTRKSLIRNTVRAGMVEDSKAGYPSIALIKVPE